MKTSHSSVSSDIEFAEWCLKVGVKYSHETSSSSRYRFDGDNGLPVTIYELHLMYLELLNDYS